MEMAEKQALLDVSLERAAERLGDITGPVMERYFARFPDSEAAFKRLWPGRRGELEGEMVERTLYCLMQWFVSPGEIEIMLLGSVPHHARTLEIPPDWYSGLIEAVIDTLAETIPEDCAAERCVWRELREELLKLVETSTICC